QAQIAALYFEDGGIEEASPPLRALLHIMRDGHYEGKDRNHPDIRALFAREAVLGSEWYTRRREELRARETAQWKQHITYLEEFLAQPRNAGEAERLGLVERLAQARSTLEELSYRQ